MLPLPPLSSPADPPPPELTTHFGLYRIELYASSKEVGFASAPKSDYASIRSDDHGMTSIALVTWNARAT